MEHSNDLTNLFKEATQKTSVSPQLIEAIQVLSDPGAFLKLGSSGATSVLKIYSLLNDKYDRDWWDWEPETIWTTISKELEIPIEEKDRVFKDMVGALQVLLSTDQPFQSWSVFENTCHAFNGNMVLFGQLQPAELNEIAWALYVMGRIQPKAELSLSVTGYIAACAKNAGVVYLPPDIFPVVSQKQLDSMHNDLGLKSQVASIWPKVLVNDSALSIQLMRLKEIKEYLEHFKEV